MNKVYLITYNKAFLANEASLITAIKSYGNWLNYTGNNWMILTSETPSQVYNKLRLHFTQNEHFLIIEVTKNYYGWLPSTAWEWMNKNITTL